MRVELREPTPTSGTGARAFKPTDVAGLGQLMYHAYLDTIDYEGESLEQASAEVAKAVAGEYGEFIPSCSRVAEFGQRIVSATLITRFQDRPFVAFTFTDPTMSRRGLARACMREAMGELFRQGERELRLVVTLGNLPALKLYASLGFQSERE